jgi:hypothetical protein
MFIQQCVSAGKYFSKKKPNQGAVTPLIGQDNVMFVSSKSHAGLRGCSMATSILHSQTFRFQITIYLEGNWDFF